MAKDKKLKAALDRYQGVDHKKEHQKKLQKQAEKRKRQRREEHAGESDGEDDFASGMEEETMAKVEAALAKQLAQEVLAANAAEGLKAIDGESEGSEADESEDAEDEADGGIDLNGLDDESESESENDIQQRNGGVDGEEDIPLSDIESLASEDKGDIIPHQRLTINNTAALQRSLRSFALSTKLPFSTTQSVTSAEPIQIEDVENDLKREEMFYQQSLHAVNEARIRLKKEGVPFSRPADYFAEMVKSEEQMGKVRQKLLDETARKKASSDAKRQRDLKKFGKQVQVAKLQERDKAKRDTMDKINSLKRKRSGGAELTANEDDMFDVALQDAAETEKGDRDARRSKGRDAGPGKRQKKDDKYGFGGKKRFAKSNDAKSSGDVRGYSVKNMKGRPAGGAKQRPGKSRRAKI